MTDIELIILPILASNSQFSCLSLKMLALQVFDTLLSFPPTEIQRNCFMGFISEKYEHLHKVAREDDFSVRPGRTCEYWQWGWLPAGQAKQIQRQWGRRGALYWASLAKLCLDSCLKRSVFAQKKFLRLMIYGYQNSVGPSLSRQQPSPVRRRPSVSLTAQPDPHLLHRDEHQLLLKPEARVWRAVRPLSALKKDPGLRSVIDFSSSSKAPDYIPCPLLSVRLSL